MRGVGGEGVGRSRPLRNRLASILLILSRALSARVEGRSRPQPHLHARPSRPPLRGQLDTSCVLRHGPVRPAQDEGRLGGKRGGEGVGRSRPLRNRLASILLILSRALSARVEGRSRPQPHLHARPSRRPCAESACVLRHGPVGPAQDEGRGGKRGGEGVGRSRPLRNRLASTLLILSRARSARVEGRSRPQPRLHARPSRRPCAQLLRPSTWPCRACSG